MAVTPQLGYIAGITFHGADETTLVTAPLLEQSLGAGPCTLYARIRVPYSAPTAAGIIAVTTVDGVPAPGSLALMQVGSSLTGFYGSNSIQASGLVAGQNVHVALVRDGSAGRLYVDGELVASGNNFAGSLTGDYLQVGNYDGKNWTDRIYRAALFNRALTVDEISRLGRHGVDEGDRWGTTVSDPDPVAGCLIDLDLSLGVGRHFPDRSLNTLGADATPGTEHVLPVSYGLRSVTKKYSGIDDISDAPGTTYLLDLPPNCGLMGVEFDVESGLGGDTLDIGTEGEPDKFVSAHSAAVGLTYAESDHFTSLSTDEYTPVYVTRSSTGGGTLKIRVIYEVRGLPSYTPEVPGPPLPTITGVDLTAVPMMVLPAGISALTAVVSGTGSFNPNVTFKVVSAPGTGLLSAITGTTANVKALSPAPITIRATSVGNTMHYDEVTVTVGETNELVGIIAEATIDNDDWNGIFGYSDGIAHINDRYQTADQDFTTGNPGEVFHHVATFDTTIITGGWRGSSGQALASGVGTYTGYVVTLRDDPFFVGPGVPSFAPGDWTVDSNTSVTANKSSGGLVWYCNQSISNPLSLADFILAMSRDTVGTLDEDNVQVLDSSSTEQLVQILRSPEDPGPGTVAFAKVSLFENTSVVVDPTVGFKVEITGDLPKDFRWRLELEEWADSGSVFVGDWHNDTIASGTVSDQIEFVVSDEIPFWEDMPYASDTVENRVKIQIRVQLL